MKARIIRDEEAYEEALAFVESLMDAEPGSQQEEELELWALLIGEYEKKQHPIEDPDPIEAIRFRLDQLGLKRKDLEGVIGTKSRVSEVMNRKRPLSLSMIRALHDHLRIPAAVLVREIPCAKAGKMRILKKHFKGRKSKALNASKPSGRATVFA